VLFSQSNDEPLSLRFDLNSIPKIRIEVLPSGKGDCDAI